MARRSSLVAASSSSYSLLLLVCNALAFRSGMDCQPSCEGHAAGSLVPDPFSCYRYYYCKDDNFPSDFSMSCPPEFPIFDAGSQSCSNVASCVTPCIKPCRQSCTDNLDLVADPLDCSKYYVCVPGGVTQPSTCPSERPYFDGEICATDPRVCCDSDDLCSPLCVGNVTKVVDPHDCRKFYWCPASGVPSSLDHDTCADGEVFDVFLSWCSSEAECYTLCYD